MLKEEHRRRIAEAIVASPHGRFQGFRLDRIDVDRCLLRLPAAAHNLNVNGRINGGAIAALIDTAATAAAWASNRVEPESRGTTVALSVNYLAPGGNGDLFAEARVTRRGRSLSFVSVSARDGEGREIAAALVTYKIDLAPA